MGRLFLCDLNVFVILCEEKEKCEENWAIFLGTNVSRTAEAISFNFKGRGTWQKIFYLILCYVN